VRIYFTSEAAICTNYKYELKNIIFWLRLLYLGERIGIGKRLKGS